MKVFDELVEVDGGDHIVFFLLLCVARRLGGHIVRLPHLVDLLLEVCDGLQTGFSSNDSMHALLNRGAFLLKTLNLLRVHRSFDLRGAVFGLFGDDSPVELDDVVVVPDLLHLLFQLSHLLVCHMCQPQQASVVSVSHRLA